MKRLLSIIGAISLLVGTNTTSLVACNNIVEYIPDELAKLKAENKIKTNNQEIRDNLEWIAPQEKPFNNVDNKYYYVVWRGDKNDNWRIVNFKNNQQDKLKNKDKYDKYKLALVQDLDWHSIFDLTIQKGNLTWIFWHNDNQHFKYVYRWNGDEKKLPNLVVYNDDNVKVKGE
ncbi:lipoprotein [Spiroplasma endosymbiont of Sarcophaga carnaria]|uniref:lipoprotein n=1 Tax=Spiroplasma endosymbiont of Sarcophaga carnaria TaxID=3066303 RepID=UPI0030CFB010